MATTFLTRAVRAKAYVDFDSADRKHRMLARTKKCGFFWPPSPSGKAWDKAYKAWMVARALDGDRFALSLGY